MRKINLAVDSANPDSNELERISRRLQKSEQSPSARSSTDNYIFFQEIIQELGHPYDVTHIPISVCQQMQRDPMMAFGLHFIVLPIMGAHWHIECERPDIAAFVDNAWRAIHAKYVRQRAEAMSFGFKPIVKRFQYENPDWKYEKDGELVPVWNNGSIDALTFKHFIGLPCDPVNVEPRWSAVGEFNGIKWQGGKNPLPFPTVSPKNNEKGRDIDLQHSLWITNEKESANESIWGYPRVGYAYRYWWSYWFRWALYDRFFERKADPPYVVYYPTGQGADYTEGDDGIPESMKERALMIGDSAKGGGTIAMPGQTINGYDERPTSIREWMIQELEVKGDMTHFVESFEYLDVMKLRSLWIPEQALMEGKGGTSSRNVAGEEISIHKEGAASLSQEMDEEINRWIIPDIVAANFPEFKGTVKKVTTGFTDADQKTMDSTLALLGQNDPDALRHIDVPVLLDRLGMPRVSLDEIRRQQEEAEKALQELPSEVNPDEQGNAGVTPQGFYVAGRPTITLSESEDFVSKLPTSRHYKDQQVLSQTKALRARWKNEFSDIYEDFAKFISKQNFDEKQANNLLDKWQYSRTKLNQLLSDSTSVVKKVITRGAKLEKDRANLTDSDWSPDDSDVADYLADRGAVYVRAVDDTIRQELRSFLAAEIESGASTDDIANHIREHFADFPGWKADRLARTEIRDAYNFATLSVGESSGIKIVQIVDALKGEEVSDPECIERNGKFFKIGEALSEVLKEHPNGTAEVKLTKRENLSVERIESDDDKLAYFDSDNDIIYLSNDIPKELETDYLISLGETLENES